MGSRLSTSQLCALEPRDNPHPGVPQARRNQPLARGDYPLHSAPVRPHREHCVRCWAPQLKDVKVLEWVQRRPAQLVKGLGGMSCEEQLRTLGLSSLGERRRRGDLIAPCSFPRRGSGEGDAELFSLYPAIGRVEMAQSCTRVGSGWTRGSISLARGWSVKHWNRIPRETIDVPSLSVIKRHLDNVLNNML